MDLKHFLVTAGGETFVFIGGAPVPDGAGHVWLTGPTGKRVLRVRREQVRESTPEKSAALFLAERQAKAAGRN